MKPLAKLKGRAKMAGKPGKALAASGAAGVVLGAVAAGVAVAKREELAKWGSDKLSQFAEKRG